MLLLLSLAQAATFDTISILAMQDYPLNGGTSVSTLATPCTEVLSPTCTDFVTAGYHQIVKELGTTIGNKFMPARTLGINGFAFGMSNTFAFVRTGTLNGTDPAGWDLASEDDEGPPLLLVPTLSFRKGLPFSLEGGLNVGWLAMTQTAVLGGYGRWGLLEGWRQFPDVTLQVGYSGYVGNEELELGTLDTSVTIGYDLAFGRAPGINTSIFSPFLGLGVQRFHGAPRVELENTSLAGRIPEVSGRKSADKGAETPVYDKQFAPFTVGGGFRILSGDFSLTVSADYAVGSIATVHTGIGFVY